MKEEGWRCLSPPSQTNNLHQMISWREERWTSWNCQRRCVCVHVELVCLSVAFPEPPLVGVHHLPPDVILLVHISLQSNSECPWNPNAISSATLTGRRLHFYNSNSSSLSSLLFSFPCLFGMWDAGGKRVEPNLFLLLRTTSTQERKNSQGREECTQHLNVLFKSKKHQRVHQILLSKTESWSIQLDISGSIHSYPAFIEVFTGLQ